MPEFKRHFTTGRMNKDLDERLIPEGEYRDAMNIQVSTSDGSDVGVIQNIKGNVIGCTDSLGNPNPNNCISQLTSTVVGSVSDEKNDSFYWFVSDISSTSDISNVYNLYSHLNKVDPNWKDGNKRYLFRDIIMKGSISYKSDRGTGVRVTDCNPVFVDVWGFSISNTSNEITLSDFNLNDVGLGKLVDQGWHVASYDNNGIISVSEVVNVLESDGIVPLAPVLAVNTSPYGSIGTFNDVGLGISIGTDNPTGFFTDYYGNQVYSWYLNGDIYFKLTAPTAGQVVSASPATMEPRLGDRLVNFQSKYSYPTPPGPLEANMVGGAAAGLGLITGVSKVDIVGDHGGTDTFYKVNIDASIEKFPGISHTSNGMRLKTQSNFGQYGYSSNSTPMTTPFSTNQGFTVGLQRQSQPQTFDSSGIVNFDPSQNHQFSGVANGDPISFNATYPNIGGGIGGYIHNLNLSNTTGVPSSVVIVDNSGNPIIPTSTDSANPTAGLFVLALGTAGQRTIAQFDSNIVGGNQQDEFFDLMFLNPERVLDFNIDKLVTGINIIDDLLFWSDGNSEPKKINTTRSLNGTPDINGNTHTDVNNNQVLPVSGDVPARKDHVTVIRKAPQRALTVKTETYNPQDPQPRTISNGQFLSDGNIFQGGGGDGVEPGETVLIAYGANWGFERGDVLKISSVKADLPDDYHMRAAITQVFTFSDTQPGGQLYSWINSGQQGLRIEILSVSDDAPIGSSQNVTWYSSIEKTGKRLFERKLPRFAYRYKYLDNEYSAISPFTDVIFLPGTFDYHPVKAYNKGMINNLKSLTLKDFVASDMPEDVIQIDLLYKNDTEPNVYLIDSIKPNDIAPQGKNFWVQNGTLSSTQQIISSGDFLTTGSYSIKSENIFSVLPSNQTLRPWDNVPKTAKAQEVTGNRIVYANYTQGYDLGGITPVIESSLQTRYSPTSTDVKVGRKSIKSLRTYDIGVVWGDKYGRETAVIAPSKGSLSVPKSRAEQSNFIDVALESSPSWADYYKFYVKETSNEYYNLALGRVYEDGEDDNVWLAFPSIDRNKVDEDTYLILKKGIGEDARLITKEARFKIVAIENEAPEQIKTSFTKLLRTNTDVTRPFNSCVLWGGNNNSGSCNLPNGGANAPFSGQLSFSLRLNMWSDAYSTVSPKAMGLTSPEKIFKEVSSNPGQDELYVGFSKEVGETQPEYSTKYHVIDIQEDVTDNLYKIKLASPILSQDSFITDATNLTNDDIHVHFWKKTIENKPEFDGRFFVKIEKDADGVVAENLITTTATLKNWGIIASTNVFKIEDTSLTGTHQSNEFSYKSGTNNTPNTDSTTKTKTDWNNHLKFGTSSAKGYWFIDKASFASIQPNTSDNYRNAKTSHSGVNSCDTTSNISSSLSYYFYGSLTGTITYNLGTINNLLGTNHPTNIGNGYSYGRLGMRGDHTSGGAQYLDLSYSKLGPRGAYGKTTNYNHDWRVGDAANSVTADEIDIVSNLKPDSRFKIKGDNSVYRIISVNKYRLYNYLGKTHVANGPGPKFSVPVSPFGDLNFWSNLHIAETAEHSLDINRRHTYRIKYELDSTMDPNSPVYSPGNPTGVFPLGQNSSFTAADGDTSCQLQFLSEFDTEGKNKISEHPAIFETEPKEDLGLNLYYEASNAIATLPLTHANKYMFAPIGSIIAPLYDNGQDFPTGIFVAGWTIFNGNHWIILSDTLNGSQTQNLRKNGVRVSRDDGSYTSFTITSWTNTTPGPNQPTNMLQPNPDKRVGLGWFNCWSFGNGVESNRIGDTFNKPFITNGVKVSSTLEEEYLEENRKYGLIYSGIYNSNSGVNNLNQFIAAEKITKDINPIYGSIQKLYSRSTADGDLITLCEDRVLKILANKDALFNADGNAQLTATNNVLGQAIPFAGEYGISKNPESFASLSYRAYFTDKIRGAVMRLSKDGLTAISDHGMENWFKENLKLFTNLIGSYDDEKAEYNLTLRSFEKEKLNIRNKSKNYTVTFQENVKGWTSFKSFILESGISCAHNYFTFYKGEAYKHHAEAMYGVDQNYFYNTLTKSSVKFIFNQMPSSVKSFETLNYEGTQARVMSRHSMANSLLNIAPSTVDISSHDMDFELNSKVGWYTTSVTTEQGKGTVPEFIGKEKKWFNYIKGSDLSMSNNVAIDYDAKNFSQQGLGSIKTMPHVITVSGCTDPNALNYYDAATDDDGSCIDFIYGCTDSNAHNFNSLANTDDSSCFYTGCTDATAMNYDNNADTDCNSSGYVGYGIQFGTPGTAGGTGDPALNNDCCTYCNYGCTDSTMFNYDSLATCDGVGGVGGTDCATLHASDSNIPAQDCDCIPIEYGCLDTIDYSNAADTYVTVTNISQTANVQQAGSCIYSGCSDPTAEYPLQPLPMPYDNNVVIPFDGSGNSIACWDFVNYPLINSANDTAYNDYALNHGLHPCDSSFASGCLQPCPTNLNDTTNCTYVATVGCSDELGCNHNPLATLDDGSCKYCGDTTAFNWDGNTCSADGSDGNCAYCPGATTDTQVITIDTQGSDVEFVIETNNQVLIDYISDSNNALGGIHALFSPVVGQSANPPISIRLYKSSSSTFVSGFEGSYDYEELEYSNILTNVTGNPATYEVELNNQTNVVSSRQNGQINSSGGYNGTTLTLEPNTYYKMAVKVICENDAINTGGNFYPSTSGWNYNVKTLQTNATTVNGCMDDTACNYNPLANFADGSCQYAATNADCNGNCLPGFVDDGNGNCVTQVDGCTDPQALNYDASATFDDGSCCYDADMNGVLVTLPFDASTGIISVDESILPYHSTATPSGSATYSYVWHTLDGTVIQTGGSSYNLNASGNWYGDDFYYVDIRPCCDATCSGVGLTGADIAVPGIDIFEGCMDDTAINYSNTHNWQAPTTTCTYPAAGSGCTDSNYQEYDPSATADDGSCTNLWGLGDSYQGGVIVHLFNANPATNDPGTVSGGGYIASNENLLKYLQANSAGSPLHGYGCKGSLIGASDIIGSGSANTDAIVDANCIAVLFGGDAAGIAARNYTGGGYTDWYLPTVMQMKGLTDDAEAGLFTLNDFNTTNTSIASATNVIYWTSTEHNINASRVFFTNTSNSLYDADGVTVTKEFGAYVRPMRDIT